MGESYLSNPLVFLVQVLFGLYALIVMLRFLLQLVRADFYNPLSQFIVRATTPALTPLRRLVPSAGGLDTASLVLAWLVKTAELLLTFLISGHGLHLLQAGLLAIPQLVELLINIFLFSIIIQVVLSWVNPGAHNAATSIVYSLTEPLLRPVRRRMPDMGGLDLSPMVVMLGLILLEMLLLPPVNQLIGLLLG